MKPLHGGEVGAVVKDVFDHDIPSALRIPMEGLRLLEETSSSGNFSVIELRHKKGEGESTKKGATYY